MKGIAPKLPLTPEERGMLRKQKVKLAAIASFQTHDLARVLGCTEERAKLLIALAQFQTIPSAGPDLAKHVIDLGVYSLAELKGKDPAELFDQLERLYGFRIDPCVEDGIRLMVHHAETPCSGKRWWDFTEERKWYRQKHGYPDTRPER